MKHRFVVRSIGIQYFSHSWHSPCPAFVLLFTRATAKLGCHHEHRHSTFFSLLIQPLPSVLAVHEGEAQLPSRALALNILSFLTQHFPVSLLSTRTKHRSVIRGICHSTFSSYWQSPCLVPCSPQELGTVLYQGRWHSAFNFCTPSSISNCCPHTSLLGYVTFSVAPNSSLILLMLTNLPSKLMLPALSFVPEAREPPNGCCPTIAPVLLQFT